MGKDIKIAIHLAIRVHLDFTTTAQQTANTVVSFFSTIFALWVAEWLRGSDKTKAIQAVLLFY